MAKQRDTQQGDGYTAAGTDLFFLGEQDVFGPEPQGQAFNMRDPRQVEERLKRRAERAERRAR